MFKFLFLSLLVISPCWADLTLEEKIGQLLLVHFNGELANEHSLTLLKTAHVGGFIYFNWANGLNSKSQVKNLSQSLQAQNRETGQPYPLFIAVDQEGGRVNRLNQGFELYPSQEERGKIGDIYLEKEISRSIAKQCAAVGVNMNLAPVVDVKVTPNSSIKDRAYSSDPEMVAKLGKAFIEGHKEIGVISILKHFPGHGAVTIDSHENTPTNSQSLDELERLSLTPFKELKEANGIMTAHILVPAIDKTLIATFSKPCLQALLRNDWHYQGIVISDSLIMKGAIQQAGSIEKAALKALQAGCDVLCLGGKLLNEPSQDELKTEDVLRIHQYLVAAVKKGDLEETQIDASVARVIALKQALPSTILAHLTELSSKELEKIGNRIWANEGSSKKEYLTFWNPKEPFPSLGIGHFIWFPEGVEPPFEETFPAFIRFAKNHSIQFPEWLASPKAPWKTREEFYKDPKTLQLQEWLYTHREIQTAFIVDRFVRCLHDMLSTHENKIRELVNTSEGIFALIDYTNFKGSGLNPKESYEGQGWGLKQVLLTMDSTSLESFKKAAISLLEQRVQNSPQNLNEQRWLPGWKKRVLSY